MTPIRLSSVRALAAASFWRQFILFMNASRDIWLAGVVNGSPAERGWREVRAVGGVGRLERERQLCPVQLKRFYCLPN